LIVFCRELIFLRPKIIISSAEKTITDTKIDHRDRLGAPDTDDALKSLHYRSSAGQELTQESRCLAVAATDNVRASTDKLPDLYTINSVAFS